MHQHQNAFNLLSGAPPGATNASKRRKKRRKKKSGKGGVVSATNPLASSTPTREEVAQVASPVASLALSSDVATQSDAGSQVTDDFELSASDSPLSEATPAHLADEEAQLREALRLSAAGTGLHVSEVGPKPSDGFTAVKTRKKKKEKPAVSPPSTNGRHLRAPAPTASSRSSASSRDGISRTSSDASLSDVTDVSSRIGSTTSDFDGGQRVNGHGAPAESPQSGESPSEVSSVVSSEPPSSATSVSVATTSSLATHTQAPRSELQPALLSAYNAPQIEQRQVNKMARGPGVEAAKALAKAAPPATPRKTSDRDALDAEIESWSPAGSPRVLHQWTKRLNREHNTLKQRRLQTTTKAPEPPPFWSMFSDLQGLERVARKVLEATDRIPFDAVAKLFALCMYGSDQFHRWFLEKLRAVSQKAKDSSARTQLIDVAMRAVSVLKIPCRPTELRCEHMMQRPFDADDSAVKVWTSLGSTFDGFLKTRSHLSALQYEIAQYTPTEEFRHQFTVAMGELDAMIQSFNSAFNEQKNLRETRDQLKTGWLEKNESEIKPREDVIQDMQNRIDAHRARKQQLMVEITRIENEINTAMHEQDRVQNAVNEWRQEIQTQVNRIEEEDNTLSSDQERKRQDLMSARAMHELLNTSRARLLQETDKNIGRFRELQANKTQSYIQSFENVLAAYAQFIDYYSNREQLLRDHLQRTKQQHQASIDLGLAAAATSDGLLVIQASMNQAARFTEQAVTEIEGVIESTMRLVDTRSPDFINFVNCLPAKVTNTLPLGALLKYRTAELRHGPTPIAADSSSLHTEEKSSVYIPPAEESTSFYDKAPPSVLDVKTQTPSADVAPSPASMSRAAQLLANGPSPASQATDFGASPVPMQPNRSRPQSAGEETHLKKSANAGRGPSNPRRRGAGAVGSNRSSRANTPRAQQRGARDHRVQNSHNTGAAGNQQRKGSDGRRGRQANGQVNRRFRPKTVNGKPNGGVAAGPSQNGGISLPKDSVWGSPRQ